jgi:hypothetical protein
MSGTQRWLWLARYTAAAAGIVSAPLAVVGGRWLVLSGCAVVSAFVLGVVAGRLLLVTGRPPRRPWAIVGGVVVALASHALLVVLFAALLVLRGDIDVPAAGELGQLVLMSYGAISLVTVSAGAWAGSAARDRLTAALTPAAP